MKFPIEYQVVEQVQANTNLLRSILSLRIATRRIASVPDGFVLVKMEAAPLNPSDIAFLQGSYNVRKSFPAVPGFEGAGSVVALGAGVDDCWLGRNVACFAGAEGDGSWAGYMLARPWQLIALDGTLSWDQMATFLVNPFTAHAMFQMALNDNAAVIAINAAGSRLAQWMRLFADQKEMKTINIVRKHQTAELLRSQGNSHVLVSTDEGFTEKFSELAHSLNCRIAFDAVGGSLGGIMLNAMPPKSRLVVYGGLSNQPLGELDVLGLIFKEKRIEGFDLNQWWASTSDKLKVVVAEQVTGLLKSGQIQTPISQVVEMKDIASGLRHYIGHMSEGKVLLRMG
jgi:NADPH:quinone reductase-like Zn-dependent oxidoreductase